MPAPHSVSGGHGGDHPTKLYKRALFEGVRYPVGKLYEDIPVAYEVTKRAHKAAHIANRDYYYFSGAAASRIWPSTPESWTVCGTATR